MAKCLGCQTCNPEAPVKSHSWICFTVVPSSNPRPCFVNSQHNEHSDPIFCYRSMIRLFKNTTFCKVCKLGSELSHFKFVKIYIEVLTVW